jgi:hypothetical protein
LIENALTSTEKANADAHWISSQLDYSCQSAERL